MKVLVLSVAFLICGCPPKVEERAQSDEPGDPAVTKPTIATLKEDREKITASAADKKLDVLVFSKDAVPKGATYKGGVFGGLRFRDSNGENHVVFSRDPLNGESKKHEVWLFANHFVVDSSGKVETLRTVKQKAGCGGLDDLIANFRPSSFGVSDLDSDGIGEATFAYAYTCTTDVSPLTYKLLMIEGGDKYILRGTTQVDAGGGDLLGGDYKTDDSFSTQPAFLKHAKSVWEKTKRH